ncbi:MAG: glycosyltransferase family 2 protein [Myxococcota bacterium]
MKLGTLVPCYEHGRTVGAVMEGLAPLDLPCLLVDDGNGPATRERLEDLARRYDFAEVVRRERRGGKGAALKTGYRAAMERGWEGVIQLDADGQHDPADVPRFAKAMEAQPGALVLGDPVFDASVPRARLYARQLSRGLVWLSCLSRVVPDPLCGFRGMPVTATVGLLDRVRTGDWMDFEPEVAVRLVWEGLPVVTVPTRVVYPPGGVSHFSLAGDYPRLVLLYTRLLAGMLPRAAGLRARAREAQREAGR